METPKDWYRFASLGDSFTTAALAAGTKGVSTYLHTVSISTTAASAVLTIKDGRGVTIAKVDGSSSSSRALDFQGARCTDGLTASLSGGNADITITYT